MNPIKSLLLLSATVLLFACSSSPSPITLAITGDQLPACPKQPNCVSSQSNDQSHYILPLNYQGSKEEAKAKLIEIINSIPNVTVTSQSKNTIKAEYKSTILSFIDDMEFYIQDTPKQIDIRSASRVGFYDFGANEKHIEEIRSQLSQ